MSIAKRQADLRDAMQNIILKAERENRDLFDEERNRFEKLKADLNALSLQTRSGIESALRRAGLPKAAARKVVGGGWPALAESDLAAEPDPQALTNLAERLDASTAEISGHVDLEAIRRSGEAFRHMHEPPPLKDRLAARAKLKEIVANL